MDSQILRTGRLIIEVRFCLYDVFLIFSRESSVVVSVCFVTLIFFVDGVIRHQALPKDEEDENGFDPGSD
jgi:hypothetical protein